MWAATDNPDGEASVERAEKTEMLDAWLQRLSPNERSLLLLRHCEGLSYRELATVMGRPAPLLKMRAHRAMGRLRAIAEESSEPEPGIK